MKSDKETWTYGETRGDTESGELLDSGISTILPNDFFGNGETRPIFFKVMLCNLEDKLRLANKLRIASCEIFCWKLGEE